MGVSPNAGSEGDSGKPEKPAKEPSGSSGVGTGNSGDSPSGSKKPSGSSSTGGKKPAGSDTSGSESSSTGGSKRPDTVCGGQFCGSEDSLVNGPGASADRWPNRHPAQNGNDAPGVTVLRPVEDTTPEENMGVVVDTDDGVAIHTRDGLIALSPGQADKVTPRDRVDVREVERPETAQDRTARPGQDNNDPDVDGEKEHPQTTGHDPRDAAGILLLGVIAGMVGVFVPDKTRKRTATSVTTDATAATTGLSVAERTTHRAGTVTKDLPGGVHLPTPQDLAGLVQGAGIPTELINALPTGLHPPTPDDVRNIANVLGVPVSQVASANAQNRPVGTVEPSLPAPDVPIGTSGPGGYLPGMDLGQTLWLGDRRVIVTGDTVVQGPDGNPANGKPAIWIDGEEPFPNPLNSVMFPDNSGRVLPSGSATIDDTPYLVFSAVPYENGRLGSLQFLDDAYVVDMSDPHHPGQPRKIEGLEQVDIAQLPDGRVLLVGDVPGTGRKVMMVSRQPASAYAEAGDPLGWVDDLEPVWEIPEPAEQLIPGLAESVGPYEGTVGLGSSVTGEDGKLVENPVAMRETALEVMPDGQIVLIETYPGFILARVAPTPEAMIVSVPILVSINQPDPTSVLSPGVDNVDSLAVGLIPYLIPFSYGPTVMSVDRGPGGFGWTIHLGVSQWKDMTGSLIQDPYGDRFVDIWVPNNPLACAPGLVNS